MDERISVIVPVYNAEPYLSACIDSILQQTYRNIEIVLVDDGSDDRSGEIADDYASRFPDRIRCIHQENCGVTTARLNGVAVSTGTRIGFVDGDDEIEPEMYERLLRNALENDADISHCGHQTIVNGGERIHYFYNTGRFVVQERVDGLKDLLIGTFEPGLWTKLFKRELVEELIRKNTVDRTIKINEDLLMNYYLFKKAEKTVFEDFCAYHYMARTSSATRSSFRIEKTMDPVRVSKRILDDVGETLKNVAWHNYLVCCLNAYMTLYGRLEYAEQERAIKKVLTKHKGQWDVLSQNERIKMKGMLVAPKLFKECYRVYEKRFQKKVYE